MGQLSSVQLCDRKAFCDSLGSGRWVLEQLAKLRSAQSCPGQSVSFEWHWGLASCMIGITLPHLQHSHGHAWQSYSVFMVGGEEKGVLGIITCHLSPRSSGYVIHHWNGLAELRCSLRLFHTVLFCVIAASWLELTQKMNFICFSRFAVFGEQVFEVVESFWHQSQGSEDCVFPWGLKDIKSGRVMHVL